jgi:hypothetical protein
MSTYNNNNNSSSTSISLRNIGGVLDGAFVQIMFSNFSATTNQPLTPIQQIYRIVPNDQLTVSADAFSWNQLNLDAQGSDGTQTINIISEVTFVNTAEPGTLENRVDVSVTFNSNFQIPTEYANSIYTIELDLQGKAQPFLGGRYVNISLVNDFADTVDVDTSKNVYNSGIKSMTSSPTLQALWDQAFHNKTPLKHNGGVVFTPAEEDALGEPVRVFDSRQHHASEAFYDPATWSDPGYGLSTGQGMQIGRRKDVIHLGFNCPEPGVPMKIGTFKLKLNQDIYATNESNPSLANSANFDFDGSLLEQLNAGQRNRNGLVNGWWPIKFDGSNITGERFLFNSGPTNIANVDYSEFTPAAPLGLIPTFREGFYNAQNGEYTHFVEGNNTGVTANDEDFNGPFSLPNSTRFGYASNMRNELRTNAEIITTWGTGSDYGSVLVSNIAGAVHGPEILSYQIAGGESLTAEEYVEVMLGTMQIDYSSTNFFHVCKSLLWWQYALYDTLDLYCWAMFPAFCMHDTARYYQTTDITRIVNIPLNPNGGSLSLGASGTYTLTKWAQTGWESEAFEYSTVSDKWTDVNTDQAFGEQILSNTTSYLHNYIREIEFDVFYTDNEYAVLQIPIDAGEVDNNGTPFKGFNPETGEAGVGITTMQEDGPPLISGYTFNLTTNICWNYFPHAEIINLGGFASSALLSQSSFRSGKSLSTIKTFTNTTQPTTGAKNRLEIKEVNLSLGSALGGARENIIPPGGIPENQSDAIVTVVGDAGAKFLVSLKELETIEIDGDNPRAAGSSNPTDAILNGGFYETIRFGVDDVYSILPEGSTSLKLPPIKAMVSSDGYRSFALRVIPYRVELAETSDDLVGDDPIPTVIKSTARKPGYRLTAGDTNFASLETILYQYPNVSIDVNVTKHDGSAYVTNYEDTTQIPHFAYESKPLGKALGAVSDITFLRDDEKNISFEVRIQKSGTFSINNEFISQEFELNRCSYNNSTTINHSADNARIVVGMLVEGEGIPEGATVVSIPNKDSFVISSATTGGDKDNQTISLSFTSLDGSLFAPQIADNGEKVHFSHLVAHVGNGLSNTDSNYATLAGRINYIQFGKRSQTFNIDLTKIFNHA